ncbi:NACHT domain-containing protein [Saccharothrix sp. BKS2]|uniref:NACHT domain-containing protein n=1 Tax=Saccharothrix sp. BKS2 TaxID=3064400 RepID=UPI0039ED30E2
MAGIEATIGRTVAQAGEKLFGVARTHQQRRALRKDARTLAPVAVADDLVAELNGEEVTGLARYLRSPAFEEAVLRYIVEYTTNRTPGLLSASIREELRLGLKRWAGLRPDLLLTATDVVFDSVVVGADWCAEHRSHSTLDATAAAASAHRTATAAANSRLLNLVGELTRIHEFADQLRTQVVSVHRHMRLPHLGQNRSVPYDQLYVAPMLRPEQESSKAPLLDELVLPGRRSVVLGDPGAGKSTLAAKLAHDIASDRVAGAAGRVPFLMVLRNFTTAFRQGGRGLAHHLEQICADPYNLAAPPNAIEYLLNSGRAVVLLDGLDELVSPELRRNVVQLVDGFASRYPQVPVIVTARRIGYADAPLDRSMFTVGVVSPMSVRQVEEYAHRWFALDTATAAGERTSMAVSFLRESGQVAELRANPLLLTLLCAMYSSEHYIPRNLAQVYERCAVMLFDQWDSMRGIAMPMQFQGRLRGAVQYLAWKLFSAEESGKALPRHRIVRLLVERLVAMKFDEDEAIGTTEQFLEFCTGRAWILTDVGATETEPRYGFTHRTFLEYFAAEYLVRTNPSAERLWPALRPHVLAGEWDVVAQIVLQLFDRNVDGGAEEVLRLVLAPVSEEREETSWSRGFAARALEYTQPAYDVIDDIASAAVRSAVAGDVEDRFHCWVGDRTFEDMRARDDALHTLMYQSAPGNLEALHRGVASALDAELRDGNDSAWLLLSSLGRHLVGADQRRVDAWGEVQARLCDQHRSALSKWRKRKPWWGIAGNTGPAQLVKKFGPHVLYLADAVLTGSLRAFAVRMGDLHANGLPMNLPALCDALMAAPRPWIDPTRWYASHERDFATAVYRHSRGTAASSYGTLPADALALVFLPYAELHASDVPDLALPDSPLVEHLAVARITGAPHSKLMRFMNTGEVPWRTQDFLVSWTRGEVSVLPDRVPRACGQAVGPPP